MSLGLATTLVDKGWVPDPLVRVGIRRLLEKRLEDEWARNSRDPGTRHRSWVARLRHQGIASEPEMALVQHYEVPTRFYQLVLGPRLKYSSAYWPEGVASLEEAEEAMLELTAERAGIQDGHRILDLGCGWGSFSLWAAERYPGCEIVAVSNSETQGEYLRSRARQSGLSNLRHQVGNVESLELPSGDFDRIVSVEMFEHMRNYEALLEKIAKWLAVDGKLFVHIFCHRELTYPFESEGPEDWMAEHFFRGGLMPAADLLPMFSSHLAVEERWLLSGEHYQRTAEAWLANLDQAGGAVRSTLESTYGLDPADTWYQRWRVFFMACGELFGTNGGKEWLVAHYRFCQA